MLVERSTIDKSGNAVTSGFYVVSPNGFVLGDYTSLRLAKDAFHAFSQVCNGVSEPPVSHLQADATGE